MNKETCSRCGSDDTFHVAIPYDKNKIRHELRCAVEDDKPYWIWYSTIPRGDDDE